MHAVPQNEYMASTIATEVSLILTAQSALSSQQEISKCCNAGVDAIVSAALASHTLPRPVPEPCRETLCCSVPLEQAVHVTLDMLVRQEGLRIHTRPFCDGLRQPIMCFDPFDLLLNVAKVVSQWHVVHVRLEVAIIPLYGGRLLLQQQRPRMQEGASWAPCCHR